MDDADVADALDGSADQAADDDGKAAAATGAVAEAEAEAVAAATSLVVPFRATLLAGRTLQLPPPCLLRQTFFWLGARFSAGPESAARLMAAAYRSALRSRAIGSAWARAWRAAMSACRRDLRLCEPWVGDALVVVRRPARVMATRERRILRDWGTDW